MRQKQFLLAFLAMLLCFAAPSFAQVAKIGDAKYDTLSDAMTEANKAAGDYTITLLQNSAEVFTFAQKSGVNITIDGDGNTFSGKITLSAGAGNLTFTDAKIAPANSQSIYLSASTAPNITFDGCTLQGANKSGTIVYGYSSATSNDLTVKDCTADNLQYIVSHRQTGSKKVVIEDVTATNMIYLARTLKCPKVTIKNTTCDAVIGVEIKNDGEGGKLTLENVNINIVTYNGSLYVPISGSGAGASWTVELKGNNTFSANGVAYKDSSWFSGNAGYVIKDLNVAKIGDKLYYDFATAIAAAESGATVKIMKNIVLDNTVVIPAGKSITLDLNEKTISQVKACTASYQMIENNGNLTITGNGKLSFKDKGAGDPSFGWGSYTINNRGTLVVENGTIEHLGEQNPGNGQPNKHMYCAIFQYSGSTTINGGKISTPTYRSARLWKGDMTINGGEFEGQLWVQAVDNSAKLTINNGTFAPRGNDGSSVFVTNDQYDVEFAVENGTFNGKIGCSKVDKLAGSIKGGKFNAAAKEGTNSSLLAEGVEFGELNNNGYCEVVAKNYIAQVGEAKYGTLTEALAAANDGDTITFMADITEDVTISKAVTIDGVDKTYTGKMTLKADATIKNVNFDGKGYNGYAVETRGANYLTIEDCTAKNYGYGFVQLASATALTTVKNVTASNMNYGVKVDYSGAVVLENVDITAGVAAVLNSNYGEKTITVKNSKLSILGTWTRDNTTKTTYVFEGANTIEKFIIDAAIDNFKLAGGATLTAPNEITVTAVEANKYRVLYADGKYTLIPLAVMIGEQGYENLADAFKAVKDGEVITLCENLTINSETYTIADGKNVTLNMNGKKITVTDNKTANYELFYIYGGLTVNGNGTIELTATNNRAWNAMSAIFHNRGGVLNVENGTFKHLGGTDMAYVIDNSGNYYGDATTNVADGELSSSYIAIRNRMEQNTHGASGKAILNVAGGEIIGVRRAIWGQAASVSTVAPATGEINVTGGNIGLIDVACSAGAKAMTTISGGTVASFKGEAGELKVTDEGQITGQITIMNAAGEEVSYVVSAEGLYICATAKIGEQGYETLAEAVAAAQAEETVTLIADATGAGVVIDKNITIDFNGKTYTFNKTVGSAGTTTLGFQILKDNNVVLKNGTLKSTAVTEGKEVKVLIQNYANLTVEDMNLVDETEHILYALSINSGNVAIKGNTNITTDAVAFDVYDYTQYYTAPKLTVETTGTINGRIEVSETINSNLVIKGGKFSANVTAWVADGYKATKNAEGLYVVAIDPVAKVGDKYYASLREAVDAAPAGAEVTLLKNVTLEGGYADDPDAGLRIEKAITIIGNKKTIDCGQFSKGIRIYINDSKKADVEFNNVTIKNDNPYGRCIDTRTKNIALEIKGNAKLIAHGVNSQPLTVGGSSATYRVRVSNATIDAGATGYGIISFVRVTNNIEVSSSSKISGLAAVYLKEGADNTSVSLGNGTYTGTNKNTKESGAFGTIVIEGKNNTITLNNEKSVVKAVSANGSDKAQQAAFLVLEGATGNKIQITNAKAKVETTGDRAHFAMIHNASNTTIVENKANVQLAAECDNYQYRTFDEAYRAANDGSTVKLLADVERNTENYVTDCDGYASIFNIEGRELTFDLNGHAINVTADAEHLTKAKGQMLMAVFSTDDGGKLTLKDSSEAKTGTVEVTAINEDDDANVAKVYSLITNYEDGCFVTIEGGNYIADKVHDSLIYSGASDCVTVNDGNYHLGNVGEGGAAQNGKPWIFNALGQNQRNIDVYGGTFNADINHQYWCFEVDVPMNLALHNNGNGTWTVGEAEAYVVEPKGDYTHEVGYPTLSEAIARALELNNTSVVMVSDVEMTDMIKVANGTAITLDLNGKTIAATDNTSKNYSAIDNRGELTIEDNSVDATGKMTVKATIDSDWNRYSAVIANNPGGKLVINGGTLEHLGGTDMAYGIDNLTNGKGTYAETLINGGTIKSTYRAIRQFLNGVEAENILTVNGGTIEGANKSIFFHDPSAKANNGTLTVGEEATLKGDVYLFVTAGSTEWPVEVMIAKDALEGNVLSANVPDGYAVSEYPTYWTVEALNLAELTIDDDCESYVNVVKKTVGTLTYERNFENDQWQTIYLPFAVPAANLMDEFEVAYIYNASYNKVDGAAVYYVVVDGNYTLQANYPYLIRAKEAGEKSIVVENAILMPTAVESIDCSSVFETFTFTGNYATIEGEPCEATAKKRHFVMNGGEWTDFNGLNPFRVYMTIELRNNGDAFPTAQSINMVKVDKNGNVDTSVEKIGVDADILGIYDLQGRRVLEPQKGEIYIINGKKVVF